MDTSSLATSARKSGQGDTGSPADRRIADSAAAPAGSPAAGTAAAAAAKELLKALWIRGLRQVGSPKYAPRKFTLYRFQLIYKTYGSGFSTEKEHYKRKMMGYRNLGHNKKVGWQDGDLQDCHTIPIERKMPVPPSP
uniref:Uncharacterized protein n=1 Tax=Pristionchus pacificus TaxID=54126 RepID=A0A2A6B6S4_PRIPA|eukprot:PDM61568.1 hypothetical protein PRIPAC_51010 [Pristionchus pacificus]